MHEFLDGTLERPSPLLPIRAAVAEDAPPGTRGRVTNNDDVEEREREIEIREDKMAVLMMYLRNSIDERHIEEIRDVTDPADVMRRFAEKYAKISPQSKRMALNALTGFTMSDEEDWDGMKRRFGGQVHDCKLMEVELNDDLIASAFLGHPSPKWMIVVQFLALSGDSPSRDQIFTGFANVEKIEGLFTKTPASMAMSRTRDFMVILVAGDEAEVRAEACAVADSRAIVAEVAE